MRWLARLLWFLGRMATFTFAKAPKGDDRPELRFLRAFLRDENPDGPSINHGGVYFCRASSYNPARAVIGGAGYHLLYRLEHEATPTYVLNLDKPIMSIPIDQWRAKTSASARDVGVELLPVCYTAYERVRVDGVNPRLIHRNGFEAVFSVGDKFYLSGYDEQEDPPLYFLCRLPHEVATVTEAREALKPESVKIAETSGASVLRQGDLFFIETELDDSDVRLAARKVVIDPASWADEGEKQRILYGTAHYADTVAHLPSGAMLAKGTVRHNPRVIGQHRGGDHSDLQLPDGWWLVSRNTVPATAGPVENTDTMSWTSTLEGASVLNDFVREWATIMQLPPWVIFRDEPGEEG